jgi:hypothetical protein
VTISSQSPGDNGQHIQAQDNQVQQYWQQPPDGQATQHPGIQELRAKIPIVGDDDLNNDDYRLNRNISQIMHHDWHRESGIDERQRNGNGEVDPAMEEEWAQLPRRVTSISSSESVGPTPSLHRVLSQRAPVNMSPGLTADLYPGVIVASTTSYTSGDSPSWITPSPSPRMSTPSSPERRNPNLYALSTPFIEPSQQQRSHMGRESPSAASFHLSTTNQQSAANSYYRGYAEPSETN